MLSANFALSKRLAVTSYRRRLSHLRKILIHLAHLPRQADNISMLSTPKTATQTGQTWNTEAYATNGRFVATLASDVVALLNPQPGERILDLGCGDGALTEQLAAAGAIVTGVDASPTMLAAARQRNL